MPLRFFVLAAAVLLGTSPLDFAIAQETIAPKTPNAGNPDDPAFAERYATSPHAFKSMAGLYAIALGGYGFGANEVNSAPFSSPSPSEIKGANVGGAAGWNFETGNLVLGFEARG